MHPKYTYTVDSDIKLPLCGRGSNRDQERIDVCKQELIVADTDTPFNHNNTQIISSIYQQQYFMCYTGWRTKCHTIDCARNTFLLLQKHLTSGTELILIGCKIVPNEEHVQCDHCFASQPLANKPLHSSQLFNTSLQKARGTTSLCGP